MGQKINSKLFRLGYKKNSWDTKFQEVQYKKITNYFFLDLEIKKFITIFFNNYKIFVRNIKIFNSENILTLFISYYISNELLFFIKNSLKNLEISLHQSKKNFKQKTIKRFWILKYLKKKKTKDNEFLLFCFIHKITETLKLYTKLKKINIISQNVNKGLSVDLSKKNQLTSFKKLIIQLRKYSRSTFYKEFINLLITVLKTKNSSKLISIYLAELFGKIKRHNFFLNFLKRSLILFIYSSLSNIKGIKILIKGRLNGKPRSRGRLLQIGKVSLQTLDSKVDYSYSTAFSSFGTFGIKVWISEKSI